MKDDAHSFIDVLLYFTEKAHKFPELAILLGLIIGLLTRQLIELADVLLIWFRNLMLGDRRRKYLIDDKKDVDNK